MLYVAPMRNGCRLAPVIRWCARQAKAGCVFWTINPGNQCWFKTRAGGTNQRAGYTSGNVNAPAPAPPPGPGPSPPTGPAHKQQGGAKAGLSLGTTALIIFAGGIVVPCK